VELTTRLHLVPRSKNEWSYTSTLPIRLHGVVLGFLKSLLSDVIVSCLISVTDTNDLREVVNHSK
jgi:hypothetical protein